MAYDPEIHHRRTIRLCDYDYAAEGFYFVTICVHEHRALFGSLERFFGILIEQYAGAFPMWLAPVQAKVLPITEKQHDYARKVAAELTANGFRVELDDRAESLGARIKDARNQRTNYIIVIGEREAENEEVGVRNRREGELGAMKLADLMKKMQFKVANKII